MAINPAKPITPVDNSFPPSIIRIEIAAVAFNVPCMTAAAITDLALMVIYRNRGLNNMHRTVIMKTPKTGKSG